MRVIAGTAKGRRLVAPSGDVVRPTADRTKEALFSILHADVIGSSVLDLFAGSGSLGIEALSRGAAHATFVERARKALDALTTNLDQTGFGDRADVLRGSAATVLAGTVPGAPFDLVLLDPPYAIDRDELRAVLGAAAARCRPGATVTVELSQYGQEPRWPSGVTFEEPRRYGDTHLHVGQVADPPPPVEASR